MHMLVTVYIKLSMSSYRNHGKLRKRERKREDA